MKKTCQLEHLNFDVHMVSPFIPNAPNSVNFLHLIQLKDAEDVGITNLLGGVWGIRCLIACPLKRLIGTRTRGLGVFSVGNLEFFF